MSEIFAKKLKEYRKELSEKRNKKIGQIQLAEELGISKGSIGNLESGKRLPSKAVLIKLVEHSGKGMDYWMDGIEEYEAPNSVELVLDKMIEKGLIKDRNLDKEVWDIIKEAVLLEIDRKLQ
ncbi:XRE family transcriptional regulator [Clostridium botulinum]|uniref:helix-turn-helix transcriptional regulator n=1 Tax=Clostridium botulinum TaxID=1491 RepID=UPI001A92C834|nr:helix-turn-helix transcriptional regulator [Clostridium botulinum]MBO0538539.1 XRE family transcriptional regulator [Clostridium botulinum]MBO0580345.1 XRE family transcriptional regulator [Clostridium botulinum]